MKPLRLVTVTAARPVDAVQTEARLSYIRTVRPSVAGVIDSLVLDIFEDLRRQETEGEP